MSDKEVKSYRPICSSNGSADHLNGDFTAITDWVKKQKKQKKQKKEKAIIELSLAYQRARGQLAKDRP